MYTSKYFRIRKDKQKQQFNILLSSFAEDEPDEQFKILIQEFQQQCINFPGQIFGKIKKEGVSTYILEVMTLKP